MKERLSKFAILNKLNFMRNSLIISSCFWIGAMLTVTQLLFVTKSFQAIGLWLVIVTFFGLSLLFVYMAYQTKKELGSIRSFQKIGRKGK